VQGKLRLFRCGHPSAVGIAKLAMDACVQRGPQKLRWGHSSAVGVVKTGNGCLLGWW